MTTTTEYLESIDSALKSIKTSFPISLTLPLPKIRFTGKL